MTAEPDQGVEWLTDTREETVELANEKRGSGDEKPREEIPEKAPPVDRGLQINGMPRRRGRVEPVGETPTKKGYHQRAKAWWYTIPPNKKGYHRRSKSMMIQNPRRKGYRQRTKRPAMTNERGRVESVDETPTR